MTEINDIINDLESQLGDLVAAQDAHLVEMTGILNEFSKKLKDAYLPAAAPQSFSVGVECSSEFDVQSGKTVGSSRYWAKPRIDKHSRELYNEIYSWCEETFNPSQWLGDKDLQIYYFNRIEDRDWFVMRWS